MWDSRPRSVLAALRHHALERGNAPAFAFLSDGEHPDATITFAELDQRAYALSRILQRCAGRGERALLAFTPGLEFVVSFFACQYAGLIAVPLPFSSRGWARESNLKIVEDCRPKVGLTYTRTLSEWEGAAAPDGWTDEIDWYGVDALDLSGEPPNASTDEGAPLSFLQYTSGSTSAPKGVMVSHANLVANLDMMSRVLDLGPGATRVGWIPLFHDMGLVFNVLQATYVGALCVLMAPLSFMGAPLSWLRAIDKYRAELAIAPNFAYDHCVDRYRAGQLQGVDLSCLRLVLNGAEPVRADTLERFATTFAPHGLNPATLHPTYGMAEATLMISGGLHGGKVRLWNVSHSALQKDEARSVEGEERGQTLVGCGRRLPGETIAIVQPETRKRLHSGQVGEIWVQGPHVAQGYWEKPEETRATFQAKLAGEAEMGEWLRTGDLGCVDAEGEVYIAGRLKDMLIVRGANFYPQDLELTAEKCHPALRRGCSAAFTEMCGSTQLLVMVHEVERSWLQRIDVEAVTGAIRSAMVEQHQLTVHHVVLVTPGTIPKTTSGKIRRRATRELWRTDGLSIVPSAHAPSSNQRAVATRAS